MSLDALMLTVDVLKELNAKSYRVLVTMVPPKPSRDGEEARIMLSDEGLPHFTTTIRRLSAFQKAALMGVPVSAVKSDPRAASAWDDYCQVGKELR